MLSFLRYRALSLLLGAVAAALCLVGSERNVLAQPTFPGYIEAALMVGTLPAPSPGCTLCHSDNNGGLGTVTRPFGLSMMSRGLNSGSDEQGVANALAALMAENIDSDHDGVGDIAEIKAGTDPNTAPGGGMPVPEPAYGCGATFVAPGRSYPPGLAAAALVGAVLAFAKRRRRLRSVDTHLGFYVA